MQSELKPGDRVAVFISSTQEKVVSLGGGVYEGQHEPPTHMMDPDLRSMLGLLHGGAFKNPRIKLDNDETVWGMQVYFMPEDKFAGFVGEREVENTTMARALQAARDNMPGGLEP